MVLNQSFGGVIFLGQILIFNVVLRHVYQRDIADHVADPEAFELEVCPVVRQLTQKLVRGFVERLHKVRSDAFADIHI